MHKILYLVTGMLLQVQNYAVLYHLVNEHWAWSTKIGKLNTFLWFFSFTTVILKLEFFTDWRRKNIANLKKYLDDIKTNIMCTHMTKTERKNRNIPYIIVELVLIHCIKTRFAFTFFRLLLAKILLLLYFERARQATGFSERSRYSGSETLRTKRVKTNFVALWAQPFRS